MTIQSIFRAFFLAVMLGVSAQAASADIVHSVKFSAEKAIILWGEDTSHTAIPSITAMPASYAMPRSQFTAPIVQTGLLMPVTDGFAPLKQDYSSRATFNVVSNTAYGVRAKITNLDHSLKASDLSKVTFAIDLSKVGSKAAAPEAGAYYAQNLTLADLRSPQTVFQSNQKTAARPGSPMDQSLEFVAEWGQIENAAPVQIAFTVFVP